MTTNYSSVDDPKFAFFTAEGEEGPICYQERAREEGRNEIYGVLLHGWSARSSEDGFFFKILEEKFKPLYNWEFVFASRRCTIALSLGFSESLLRFIGRANLRMNLGNKANFF